MRYLFVLVAMFCCLAGAAQEQSLGEAARQIRKTQNKSRAATKKVYTNDDLAHSAPALTEFPSKDSAQKKAQPSDAAAKDDPFAPPVPGADSAEVELNVKDRKVKRGGSALVFYAGTNNSNHQETLQLQIAVTGPCNYSDVSDWVVATVPGEHKGTSYLFVPQPNNCAGDYKIELRALVKSKLLKSTSQSISVE